MSWECALWWTCSCCTSAAWASMLCSCAATSCPWGWGACTHHHLLIDMSRLHHDVAAHIASICLALVAT